MANSKNTKQVTVNKENTTKETKTMKETKAIETKEVKTVETKKNETKVNKFLTIEEIVAMYKEAGIQCANPDCKGNYRIMGTKKGSSLNVKPKLGYYIYTTNEDFANIKKSGLKADDLKVEEGTNSQDRVRPNTIICTAKETLKEVLKLYAKNDSNKIKVAETAVATK